jgi:uncharacterized protein YggE
MECSHVKSGRELKVLVALFCASAVFFGGSLGAAAEDKRMERTITVSGTGIVKAEPNVAYVSTGVVTEGATAKEAIARNTAAMSKLVDGLKKSGIAAGDIQTTTFNVGPRYTQPKDGKPATINGYQVTNQIRLTIRNVAKLGDLLDEAIALGANQVNHIAFDVADADALKDEARKQAVTNARKRAELYATAAGASLGDVLRISEDGAGFDPVLRGRVALQAAVPVEPGTRTLEVEVHVTYALR